ncbi:MAG: 50S ribosomal protein L22 [Alphaproteobacteria bacterium]|jgi:large subunit ribosomal protein L22|nr:MAG: 50S ribosomal protein L22 [Alphaproteobacteria bacterium]
MTVVREKQRGPDGKNRRREASNEAKAVLRTLRISPQKLNLVAQSIRGLSAEKAVNELRFSQKRIAKDVLKCLKSAIDNAENNHGLDVDGLVVAQAHVGKNITMKRMHTRARGRGVRIEKLFSQITIVLRDTTKQPENAEAA